MRWPHESAITRRDDHLARTRKLSIWIAGGATAASLGLATALGYALPGHAVTTGSASQTSGASGQGSTGQGNGGITPPAQAPAPAYAPPVVSSGGS